MTVVLFLAGLNAGCAGAPLRGTVTELEYEKSKTVCKDGTKLPGSTKPPLPTCTVVAECWEIDVVDSKGNEHELCINKSSWENYRVGDLYPHKPNW